MTNILMKKRTIKDSFNRFFLIDISSIFFFCIQSLRDTKDKARSSIALDGQKRKDMTFLRVNLMGRIWVLGSLKSVDYFS